MQSNIQDIPKIYTAAAEWMACLVFFLVYTPKWKKIQWKRNIPVFGLSLVCLILLQNFCGKFDNGWWLVGMSGAVVTMMVLMKAVLGTSWREAAYIEARAFMQAEFVAAFNWQIYAFYFYPKFGLGWISLMFTACVYLLFYYFLYRIESGNIKANMDIARHMPSKGQLFLVWGITLLIFGASNLSYVSVVSPFSSYALPEVFNTRTLFDLVGVLVLELYQFLKMEMGQKQEMLEIQKVMQIQYKQFRESQDNIDMINRKYHDLKHQLQILRQETDMDKRADYLDQIEDGLKKYELENKTQNPVLDTILTTKSNQCMKFGITLTVVADGALLNHMHVMDISSIFGNALDNAIRYEAQIKDPDKRLIHLSIAKKQGFICIVIENYFEGGVVPDGYRQCTTQDDELQHGYGVKSIRYTVEKYGGTLHIETIDNWFRLEILFSAAE